MTRHSRKRGFNLIEAAIVLGVVGVIVGAIWVAAANMVENYRVNKTVADLTLIARNIQNMISLRDAETLGDAYNLREFIRTSGVLPKDWETLDSGTIYHPLGNKGHILSRTYLDSTYNNFNLQLFKIKKSHCIGMLVKLSSLRSLTDRQKVRGEWSRIQVNSGEVGASNFTTFPISIEEATTACYEDKLNEMYIYYPFYQ